MYLCTVGDYLRKLTIAQSYSKRKCCYAGKLKIPRRFKKMKRLTSLTIILLLIGVLSLSLSTFAETVTFKWGTKVEAKIIKKTDSHIKIETEGVELVYSIEDIESIDGEKIKRTSGPMLSPAVIKLGSSVAQIFEKSAPAVVAIDGIHPNRVNAGSGFVVDKSGIVVTNFHVVAGAERINVIFKNKLKCPVSYIVAYNPQRDICVLKIEVPNLPVLPLGDSNNLITGQDILAVGVPGQNLEYKISECQFLRNSELYGQNTFQFKEIKGSLTEGYSGGPLLDMQGQVIGINTSIETHSKSLNFAIPINEVKDLMYTDSKITIEEMRANKISRAYAFFGEAESASSQDDFYSSIDYYKQAIALYPDFIKAYCKLGNIYLLIEAPDKAINVLKKAIVIDSNCAFPYNTLTIAYAKKGMLNEAIVAAKEGISIDDNDPRLYATLGFCYLIQNMFDDAIEHFKKAIAVDSTFSTAYVDLAYAYYEKGRYNLAIINYDKALELGEKIDPELSERLRPYR